MFKKRDVQGDRTPKAKTQDNEPIEAPAGDKDDSSAAAKQQKEEPPQSEKPPLI